MLTRDDLKSLWGVPAVRAFAMVVRAKESSLTDGAYFMRYPGKAFTDLSRHPRIMEPTTGGRLSSAAGAYQITWTTYKEFSSRYGLSGFSRETQDLLYVALIAERGGLARLKEDDFEGAVEAMRPTWTSLPGAAESRSSWTMQRARELFEAQGQQFRGEQGPAFASDPETVVVGEAQPPDVPVEEERTMAFPILAVLNAFGGILAEMLPQAASILNPKPSEVASRNVASAKLILDTVVKATGEPNVQSAIEAMQEDPETMRKAQHAVADVWPQIVEVGGGIKAARESAEKYLVSGAPGFWLVPHFYIAIVLLGFVGLALGSIVGLWGWTEGSEQTR